MSRVTTGAGATTGCSAGPTTRSTGRLTRAAASASSPTVLGTHAYGPVGALRMARSVATAIQEGNPTPLTVSLGGTTLHGHMPDGGLRARLLHVAIWLATLLFAAMLFVPLVREALRRAAEPPPGGPF